VTADRPASLFQVLDAQADALGDRIFLTVDEDAISYAGLRERSERFAGGLQQLGLVRGDRVAVLTENSIELVVTLFACARLGLVLVPLNMYLRGEFLRFQLAKSGAAAAVVDAPGLEAVRAIERPSSLRHLIVTNAAEADGELVFDALAQTPPVTDRLVLSSSDPAAIMFTSGTTGMPKGCVLPHGVFTRWHPVHQEAGYILPGDVMITPSPMFHQGFLGAMLTPALWSGASVYAMRQFRAATFMATAREVGATVIYAVGTIGMLLLAQPPGPGDAYPGKLRVALLPPMPPASQRAFEERFNVPVVADSYGQTEVLVIGMSSVDGPRKPGSAGRPAPHVEVAVVDDDDDILPTGQVGEIVVRPRVGDTFFSGYWDEPAATLATWRNLWHHTGDLGRQDQDGTLWILDRKKDAVRRRGENVSSVELENAIRMHPLVKEVAVHAVPSDIGDDDIKACIVLQPESTLEPEELFAYFKRTLPYFAVPRYVEFLPALPVNAVGRVTKVTLRERGLTTTTLDLEALGLVVERTERRGQSSTAMHQ
jgi:crotonobetaine/carnitine-CoA ligase